MLTVRAPDLASPEFRADPHPFYARLRAEAPVYRTRLTAWLVTRYDDVAFVLLSDHDMTRVNRAVRVFRGLAGSSR